MRIVTWKARGGFHVKHQRLAALAPTIAVVAECADPDVLRRKSPNLRCSAIDWICDQLQKVDH